MTGAPAGASDHNARAVAKKILQVIPSEPGWRAVFGGDVTSEETELYRVVAWALVEDDEGEREVVGMIVDPISQMQVVLADAAVSPGAGELTRYGYKPS